MTASAIRDRPLPAGPPARPMPDVPGVTHRFVEARGARFHVALAGSENGGEPVVLLHGLPQHWYAWRQVIPQLADRNRLYCVDLRGCGWSQAAGPSSRYSAAELARDVLAVLDALGLAGNRVRLIGHDIGGWVGFELCLMAPERFSRFVALNVTHPWPGRAVLARHAWRFWYTAFWEYPGPRGTTERPVAVWDRERAARGWPSAAGSSRPCKGHHVSAVHEHDAARVPTSLILNPARENPGGLSAGAQLNTASELAVRTLPPLAVPLLLNPRVEASNAVMGLLAGAQMAAHMLQLTEGSDRLLPEIFPQISNLFGASVIPADSGRHEGGEPRPVFMAMCCVSKRVGGGRKE